MVNEVLLERQGAAGTAVLDVPGEELKMQIRKGQRIEDIFIFARDRTAAFDPRQRLVLQILQEEIVQIFETSISAITGKIEALSPVQDDGEVQQWHFTLGRAADASGYEAPPVEDPEVMIGEWSEEAEWEEREEEAKAARVTPLSSKMRRAVAAQTEERERIRKAEAVAEAIAKAAAAAAATKRWGDDRQKQKQQEELRRLQKEEEQSIAREREEAEKQKAQAAAQAAGPLPAGEQQAAAADLLRLQQLTEQHQEDVRRTQQAAVDVAVQTARREEAEKAALEMAIVQKQLDAAKELALQAELKMEAEKKGTGGQKVAIEQDQMDQEQEERTRKARSPPKKDTPSPVSKRSQSFKSAENADGDTSSRALQTRFSELLEDAATAMETEEGETAMEEGEALGVAEGEI